MKNNKLWKTSIDVIIPHEKESIEMVIGIKVTSNDACHIEVLQIANNNNFNLFTIEDLTVYF